MVVFITCDGTGGQALGAAEAKIALTFIELVFDDAESRAIV